MSSTKSDYLNPKQVTTKNTVCTSGTITVRCYSNGVWDICPNPLKPSKSEPIAEQYDKGQYISWDNFCLSQKDFDDPKNWNS